MSIPGYETQETYTQDELNHVVAREVMKHRLDDLKTRLDDQGKMMNESIAGIESQLKRIFDLIEKSSSEVEKCRKELKDEMRSEVKAEYATRLELHELRSDLRVLSTKIITAVSIIVTLIQFGFQYFGK